MQPYGRSIFFRYCTKFGFLDATMHNLPLFYFFGGHFQAKHLEDKKKQNTQLQTGYEIMQNSNPTCICQIINPAHHKVAGAGFDIARLTTKTPEGRCFENMSSISLNLSTNSTQETPNPRRDSSIPSVSAGLPLAGQKKVFRNKTRCQPFPPGAQLSGLFVGLEVKNNGGA